MNKLSESEFNEYSQNGEDGVIREILKRLNQDFILDKRCVEFGASDGITGSITLRLVREDSYESILIEPDKRKFFKLKINLKDDKVIALNSYIDFEGDNTFDNIVKDFDLPYDFDLLSIDIDGCDYHVFDSIKKYRPKVVVIEYNYTIPNEVAFIQTKNLKINHGSSAKAINQLANSKGYKLIYANLVNLIFAKNEYLVSGKFHELNLSDINALRNEPTYLFVGYDGTLLSNKQLITFPWQRLQVPLAEIHFFPIHVFLRVKNPFFKYPLLYIFLFIYLFFYDRKELHIRIKKFFKKIKMLIT